MHSSLAFSEFEYTLFCILIAPNHRTPVTSVRGIQGIKASIPGSWTWSLFYCLCLQVILQRSSAGPEGHAGHVLCVPVPCEPGGSWSRRWGLCPRHCVPLRSVLVEQAAGGGADTSAHSGFVKVWRDPGSEPPAALSWAAALHPGHPAGPGLWRGLRRLFFLWGDSH